MAYNSKECYDHLGKKYNSISDMCREHGINKKVYDNRIRQGWSLEKTLTTPLRNKNKECYDHLGRKYDSIGDMCKAYGITRSAYDTRIKIGWSLEKALTTSTGDNRKECFDHLGKKYESISDMCKAYGLRKSTFLPRVNMGWDLEKALTTPLYDTSKKVEIFGMKFESIADACKELVLDYGTLKDRLRKKYSFMELEVIGIKEIDNSRLPYQAQFIGLDGKAYYKMPWSIKYVTTRQVIEHYRPDLLELYDKSNPTGRFRPYKVDIQE